MLVREPAMEGTGFFPEAREQVYARAERRAVPGRHRRGAAGVAARRARSWTRPTLPLRYVGFSTCFRREAGAAGKDTRGIFRVHQFDKLEMFIYCLPEPSWDEHEALLAIEEEIAQELGFHYRVQNIAVGDLGALGREEVRHRGVAARPGALPRADLVLELHRLPGAAARHALPRREAASRHVHMLNGTAVTSSRTLLALIEYGQQADGSIATPPALHPFGAPPLLAAL